MSCSELALSHPMFALRIPAVWLLWRHGFQFCFSTPVCLSAFGRRHLATPCLLCGSLAVWLLWRHGFHFCFSIPLSAFGRRHLATPCLSGVGIWPPHVCFVGLSTRLGATAVNCLFVDPRLLSCLGAAAVDYICLSTLLSCRVASAPQLSTMFVCRPQAVRLPRRHSCCRVLMLVFNCLGALPVHYILRLAEVGGALKMNSV